MAQKQQSPNYDALLSQIQTLSDLQNNGGLQGADPAKQAAYIRKLQQQAESIRRMLKLLNVSDNPPPTTRASINGNCDSNGQPGDLSDSTSDFNGHRNATGELNGYGDFSERRKVNGGVGDVSAGTGGGDPGEMMGYEQLWELSTTGLFQLYFRLSFLEMLEIYFVSNKQFRILSGY